jgi:hypothetical protein
VQVEQKGGVLKAASRRRPPEGCEGSVCRIQAVHRQLIKDATAVVIKYRDHQWRVYHTRERESADVVEQTYVAE